MVYLFRLNFKFRYFPGWVGGWVGVGGWVRVENKAKLSPAGAGAWTELGKIKAIKLNLGLLR
jgi:hypothetical protein